VERQRVEEYVEPGAVEPASVEREAVDAGMTARVAVEAEDGRARPGPVSPPARADDPVLRERREVVAGGAVHREEIARERDVDARAAVETADGRLANGVR
jgi:hypothetical protein